MNQKPSEDKPGLSPRRARNHQVIGPTLILLISEHSPPRGARPVVVIARTAGQ
jgi:hypothetical protein